uniref:non-specific serine/threonine protein kinase n=1 Tax=Terrapene triunguis TaxID=2587831 RepID=A0A674JSX8_9SAUR
MGPRAIGRQPPVCGAAVPPCGRWEQCSISPLPCSLLGCIWGTLLSVEPWPSAAVHDGTPLSELSWSSSLAVVALSFSGLFTFIFLMLACLCCKKGDIGFKEFENAEGEDYVTEFSVQGSPATQNGPEVYILPLTEVSLPMAKQPGRSVQLLKSAALGRHSLLYLQEIGHGWFGKVFLGEVNSGLSSTQVVVKELKVSASVQDQMQFLEEAQPYRALQHTNLLQCLAQCAEVTPYLLVMEFCPLGDLKGYLRSCQVADSMAPDPLTLQRMACEVACGILHLHRNHYVHSDLALRNCLLTADLTVKVGDYGLARCKYKDDYFVTADQLWVPLRWIAPELIDEVHGNLLIVDQTKSSNVWSLGVTIWELFELGNQPYYRYSDRQVLTYAIKEQQLKLPKPQLKLLLSERWYEVMQFCWLQPEQRPTAEEVHLLLSYLCAKGATEAEEEFERRWNSMKPNSSSSSSHRGTEVSSFPLLEQFSAEGFHSDGDDVLTVMETSQGLNFEYKWEPSKAECFQVPTGALSPSSAAQYQDLYYPTSSMGVVPILGAHSPSLSSEYYIRIEGPSEGRTELDYAMCSYSPDCEYGSPAKGSRWQAKRGQDSGTYDSDNSPTVSLTMEPLLGHATPSEGSWEHPNYYPYQCHSKEPPYYQPSPGDGADHYLLEEEPLEASSKEWQVPSFQKNIFEDPLGISPSVNCAYSPPSYEEPHPAPLAGRLLECVGTAVQRQHWTSNSSANNNSSNCPPPPCEPPANDSWCYRHMITFRGLMAEPLDSVPRDEAQLRDLSESTTMPAEGAALPLSPGEWAVPYDHTEGNPCADCTQIPSEASEAAGQVPGDIAVESGKSITSDLDRTPDKTFSSTSFPDMDDCSDEDTAELTSGVFTDFSGDYMERVDVIPSFKSLQKQVGTPDSLESLDIPSTASSCEVFSPTSYVPSSQPKALDSGYDTENYESPEFVLKEPHEPREPETFTHLGKSPVGLAVGEGDGVASEMHLSSSFSAELHGLSEKNPYRDSAYFSDYDTDAERYLKEDEDSDGSEAQDREAGPGEGSVQAAHPEPELELEGAARAEETAAGHSPDSDGSRDTTWEECPAIPSIPAESVPSKSFFLSPVVTSPEGPALLVLAKASGEELLQEGLSGLLGEAVAPSSEPEGPEHPLEEPGVRVAPEGEPEEEEEDTEDSDESDEELRCYNIQEQSEESEDEPAAVPIVVAESHSARNLRSLLKMPNLLSQTFCEDLERKKKAVSFYDDVTVYLFDQESPTRELSDQTFPEVTAPSLQPVQSNSPTAMGLLPDVSLWSCSAPGGGFEWDDDFPLMPVKSSLMSSLTVTPVMPVSAIPSLPSLFSRFTVSPAPVSRFSITHVSDSDMESVGGEGWGWVLSPIGSWE